MLKKVITVLWLVLFATKLFSYHYNNILNFAEVSYPYSPQNSGFNPSTGAWLDGFRVSLGYEDLYVGLTHDALSSGLLNLVYSHEKYGAAGLRISIFNSDHYSHNSYMLLPGYTFQVLLTVTDVVIHTTVY